MRNDVDEMFEVSDFDEDVKLREEILKEVRELQLSEDWNEDFKTVMDIQRKWRRIHYWESAYEDSLMEEFEQFVDGFFGKRNAEYKAHEDVKKALIERARKAAVSEDWNKASEDMKVLMDEWKVCPSAGREKDDALWEEFNSERQKFFDRKHAHWEDMQAKFEASQKGKQELIEKAASLKDSEEWKKTGEIFKELLDAWKAFGSAGKEEEQLWEQFNAYRQAFYDRRNAHYNTLREEFDAKYEEKQKLLEQARNIVETKEYTRENTQKMKGLGVEWKGVGSCGKDREDTIWQEFRSVMDAYFHGLKEWNEQKHANWRNRMLDIRNRKADLILKQKQQIKRMQADMVGLLGERAIADMEDAIADKEAFIQELEEEIADIDAKLENDK